MADKQVKEDRHEKRKQTDDEIQIIDLADYRNKKAGNVSDSGCVEGIWERTSLPLLQPEHAEAEAVRIVKVSSGFGKLAIPSGDEQVRCMAAA